MLKSPGFDTKWGQFFWLKELDASIDSLSLRVTELWLIGSGFSNVYLSNANLCKV